MFTFIKKLFGFDQPTMKDAGVQIEQAPYKVPEPVVVTPTLAPVVASVTDTVVITPEAVAPTLVSDTIVTEVAPVAAMTAKPKKSKAPAKAKAVTKPKPVAAVKKTRKPRSKKV